MTEPFEGDEMLRAAAIGRLDHADPRVAARLAGDAEFARAVREFEETRAATERVLREGARLTEEARRNASDADRVRVLDTLEGLARDARASRRRGRFLVLAGLAAAAVLAFLLLRPESQPPPQEQDLWMGETPTFRHEASEAGPGKLIWDVELLPGDELWLSFFELRDGERGEPLLAPIPVTEAREWLPTTPDERARYSGAWVVELELRSSGESRLVGSLRHSLSR